MQELRDRVILGFTVLYNLAYIDEIIEKYIIKLSKS